MLLVEDSPLLRARLGEALSTLTRVHLLPPVDTELAAVESLREDAVDVLILDLQLRIGTGFGVLRRLEPSRPRPVVIVLTNYDLPEYRRLASSLGVDHFLDKARDGDTLLDLVGTLSAGQD